MQAMIPQRSDSRRKTTVREADSEEWQRTFQELMLSKRKKKCLVSTMRVQQCTKQALGDSQAMVLPWGLLRWLRGEDGRPIPS